MSKEFNFEDTPFFIAPDPDWDLGSCVQERFPSRIIVVATVIVVMNLACGGTDIQATAPVTAIETQTSQPSSEETPIVPDEQIPVLPELPLYEVGVKGLPELVPPEKGDVFSVSAVSCLDLNRDDDCSSPEDLPIMNVGLGVINKTGQFEIKTEADGSVIDTRPMDDYKVNVPDGEGYSIPLDFKYPPVRISVKLSDGSVIPGCMDVYSNIPGYNYNSFIFPYVNCSDEPNG